MRWHRWFAWRPVCTYDRGWVWLRGVNRRICWVGYSRDPRWEYRIVIRNAG